MKLVVTARACQERGRGVMGRGDVHRRPTRVDQSDEIGTVALLLNRVGGVRLAPVKANVGEGSQRASSGKAQNAYAIRLHAPLPGPCAYDTQGALRVLERLALHRVVIVGRLRQPVLENERADADAVEPLRNIRPFRSPD